MNEIVFAEVIAKEAFFKGQRVLLDFMESFDVGDYIFVGSTNHGFVALASENHETPNYEPRRFRFNIGSLHQYVLVDEEKVQYADELKSGDVILIGGKHGFRRLPLARVKKEMRPFIKLSCRYNASIISVVLQAEATAAVFREDGLCFLSQVEPGDRINIMPWGKASHLGNSKDEFCEEK